MPRAFAMENGQTGKQLILCSRITSAATLWTRASLGVLIMSGSVRLASSLQHFQKFVREVDIPIAQIFEMAMNSFGGSDTVHVLDATKEVVGTDVQRGCEPA